MSSATGSPRTEASLNSSINTPPSSPPSEKPADITEGKMANGSQSISESMQAEEQRMQDASRKVEAERERRLEREREADLKGGREGVDTKYKALEYLLSQSKLYSTIMLQQMQKQEAADTAKDERAQKKAQRREEKADQQAQEQQRKSTRAAAIAIEPIAETTADKPSRRSTTGRQPALKKQTSKITDYVQKSDVERRAGATVQDALEEELATAEKDGVETAEVGVQNLRSARQPDLVSGGTMRGYQLEGLEWLTSLYENGLNGILADEMGLGKTVQTISFLAFLRERGVYGPFLIAAPLSTTNNWVEEFKRWTPDIPVVLYHGTKQEREDMRNKVLRTAGPDKFPVICTSYEICMNDRKFLSVYGWKFIIIDEGHRIKNLNCRLIRELQSYQSANRLLITGTPLQNNLAELWSLLHFLMPEIFDKLEAFESWFDFSALKEKGGHEQILNEERKKNLVASLHAILKPFLLRRVKADVETSLPKKREYILYAPLTAEQKELYQEILTGNSRTYLEEKVVDIFSRPGSGASTPISVRSKRSVSSLKRKAVSGTSTPNKSTRTSRASTPANSARSRRGKKRQSYEEVSDRAYFKQLEDVDSETSEAPDESEVEERQRAKTLALAKRQISQKKLQNPVMQLRLCCNSPHNFYDPFTLTMEAEELTGEAVPEPTKEDYRTLITASGKMQLLDRLLTNLLDEGHKVLIFSQFKSQLDLIALYLEQVRSIPYCRIDGSVANSDRQEQIRMFNKPTSTSPRKKTTTKKAKSEVEDGEQSVNIFLLTTRAGGQGINLAAADTVLLFDSDWNPQQDLQAQDRAHRIGQQRNVIVYRFATRGTVEELLLGKAEGKRRLEKLVIRRGGLKSSGRESSNRKATSRNKGMADEDDEDDNDNLDEELRDLLGRDDGQRLDIDGEEVLSDADLRILTDRSDEAYVRAEKGLDNTGHTNGAQTFQAVETKKHGDGILDL